MLLNPSPCHKLSHLLGPPPLERDVLYGRPYKVFFQNANRETYQKVRHNGTQMFGNACKATIVNTKTQNGNNNN